MASEEKCGELDPARQLDSLIGLWTRPSARCHGPLRTVVLWRSITQNSVSEVYQCSFPRNAVSTYYILGQSPPTMLTETLEFEGMLSQRSLSRAKCHP